MQLSLFNVSIILSYAKTYTLLTHD